MHEIQRQVLVQALKDPDGAVRAAASKALENLEAVENFSVLKQALDSDERERRVAAVYTLAQVRSAEVGTLLVQLLQDADPDVRAVAAQVVGKRCEKAALSALVRCLKDENVAVAVHAARAMARFQDRRLVPYLQAMCRSGADELVSACLDALAEIGDIGAVETGAAAARHSSPGVRLSAVQMLGRLQEE